MLSPLALAAAVALSTSPGNRLAISIDLFGEGSRLEGTQVISDNTSEAVRDESFDYQAANFISATAAILFAKSPRLRVGPGWRILGPYAAGGDQAYTFGILNEFFALAEYGLPAVEKLEVVLGGRVGASLMFPTGDFLDEIERLQADGITALSLPRLGWFVGFNGGMRRKMSDRVWLRADILAQLGRMYLFATDDVVSGLRFRKHWSTHMLRYGLTLGVELAL
jgi:hypothetical protein